MYSLRPNISVRKGTTVSILAIILALAIVLAIGIAFGLLLALVVLVAIGLALDLYSRQCEYADMERGGYDI